MYWILKLHKIPVGSWFIIASKSCSTEQFSRAVQSSFPLSRAVFKVFKLISSQIKNFHLKSKFLSNYNKFRVLQNVDSVIENISIINRKKKAESIAKYDFNTLCATLPYVKLISPIQDGLFWGCSQTTWVGGWVGGEGGRAKRLPLAKICHTYPTMMQLGTVIPYLKKIQKIYESRHTPLEFC